MYDDERMAGGRWFACGRGVGWMQRPGRRGSPATVTVTVPASLASPATVTVTVPASPATVTALPQRPASTTRPVPANPVLVLEKVKGCVLPADTKTGLTDINGNRYAGCDLNGKPGYGLSVDVRTYPGDPKVLDPHPLRSDDSKQIITGPDFILVVSGNPKLLAKVNPAEIAAQVGGTLVPVG